MLYLRSAVSFLVALVVALVGFLPFSAVAQPVSRPFLLPVPPNAEYLGYADVSRLEGQPFLADLVAPFSGDLYFFERPDASAITAVAFYGSFERFPDWSLLLAQRLLGVLLSPLRLDPGLLPAHRTEVQRSNLALRFVAVPALQELIVPR